MVRCLLLMLLIVAGCKRAERDIQEPLPGPERPTPKPIVPEEEDDYPIDWINLGREPTKGQTRIEFVHYASSPEEWGKLKTYWNEPTKSSGGPVRVKVPLGLDDPTSYVPTHSTLTRERWELGARLFFDEKLLGEEKLSCASCHNPTAGYTDNKRQSGGSMNTPTLVNVVFNRSQFWDGRVTHLEEVMQRERADERRAADGAFRHNWPGVIGRLRKSEAYRQQFGRVFDAPPTQHNAGIALATYLRTLLAGNSLHDRAEQMRKTSKSGTLQATHYEAVLNDETLKKLDRGTMAKGLVAEELVRGHDLFHKIGCVHCHPAGNGVYSDQRFHNIGIDPPDDKKALEKRGRFNVAPFGEKSRWTMGAFKTPTLRGLSRTWPYFHNGQEMKLLEAVRWHVDPKVREGGTIYLSPPLGDPITGVARDYGLRRDELEALTQFLRALDGEEVDPFVRRGG